MLSMGGRALGITRKRSRVPDPELRRDEPDHSIGNLRRARQEDAEESDRPQLDCKPEPILIPSARGNHRTIMGVEMKVPSELLGRRLSSILAVGGSLRFAQEVDRACRKNCVNPVQSSTSIRTSASSTLGRRSATMPPRWKPNAALRSIVRRDSEQGYEEFLMELAKASGIETPRREDLARLDRKRTGKG